MSLIVLQRRFAAESLLYAAFRLNIDIVPLP